MEEAGIIGRLISLIASVVEAERGVMLFISDVAHSEIQKVSQGWLAVAHGSFTGAVQRLVRAYPKLTTHVPKVIMQAGLPSGQMLKCAHYHHLWCI